jgi:hypothetical protein
LGGLVEDPLASGGDEERFFRPEGDFELRLWSEGEFEFDVVESELLLAKFNKI